MLIAHLTIIFEMALYTPGKIIIQVIWLKYISITSIYMTTDDFLLTHIARSFLHVHIQWILPTHVTYLFCAIAFILVVIFAAYCGEILDTERRSWSENINIFCDVLPA